MAVRSTLSVAGRRIIEIPDDSQTGAGLFIMGTLISAILISFLDL
jgi:hypothetical protein